MLTEDRWLFRVPLRERCPCYGALAAGDGSSRAIILSRLPFHWRRCPSFIEVDQRLNRACGLPVLDHDVDQKPQSPDPGLAIKDKLIHSFGAHSISRCSFTRHLLRGQYRDIERRLVASQFS